MTDPNIKFQLPDAKCCLGMTSIESACHVITTILRNNADIPYAIFYMLENQESGFENKPKRMRLEATTFDNNLVPVKRTDGSEEYMYIHGISSRDIPDNVLNTPDLIVLPESEEDIEHLDIYSTTAAPWPIERAIYSGDNVIIRLPDDSLAVLCPVTSISSGKDVLTAVMICGINKHRALDEDYQEFLRV